MTLCCPLLAARFLFLFFLNKPFNLADGFGYGDNFGADVRAPPHGLAPPSPVLIIELSQSAFCGAIAGVGYIPEGAEQSCGTKIVLVCPADRARGSTGTAEDATEGRFKRSLIRGILEPLGLWRLLVTYQVGSDLAVLFKERIHVNNQIFDHPEEGQRFDHKVIGSFKVPYQFLTGQLYSAVDHKSVRAADTVGARIAVAQGGILVPPYLVQTVKDLVCGFRFNGVFLIPGLFIHRRVEAINYKGAFHLSISFPLARIWLW